MSDLVRTRMPVVGRALTVASAAAVLLVTLFASGALAHGAPTDPAARQYSCWERWGDDFQNPDMETEDPMCWQAWQADPNAMWNWNGLYQNNVGGDHETAVPDGQLCSGGLTENGRYAALDEPGPWQATPVDNDFTLTYNDAANHGADYYRVYVTEQGFDPTTAELAWSDLELVTEVGPFEPGDGTANPQAGVDVEIDVSAPGRTGHHIVYTVWQASHMDQTFYACSDVLFPGGDGDTPVAEEPGTPAEDLSEPEVPDAQDPGSESPESEVPEGDEGDEPVDDESETSDTGEIPGEEPADDETPGGGLFDFDALFEQLSSVLTLFMGLFGF